jgi:hypothetical protein
MLIILFKVRIVKKIALYVLVSASLLGCGSDDSKTIVDGESGSNQSPDVTPNPSSNMLSGIYTGTTGIGQTVEGLIDDDNRFWFIYLDNDEVSGFISSDGKVKANNNKFSEKGKDYSYRYKNVYEVTIAGEYQKQQNLKGTITERSSEIETYNLNYDQTLSDKKQTLDMINNRTFLGSSYMSGDNQAGATRLKFGSNGTFTGNGEGCEMQGTFKPSDSGRYFVSTVTFGYTTCTAPGETHTGVALLDEDNELIFLGTDNNRNKGVFFSSGYW